jgi:hypothetical protein
MRKFISFIFILLLMSSFLSCDSDDNLPIYGEYHFHKMIYLSPLSSVSLELSKELRENTQYEISKDSFRVISDSDTYEIEDPTYETIKMNEEQVKVFHDSVLNSISLKDYKYKYQYDIYDKEGNKSNYRIYLMDDELWLASYLLTSSEEEYIFDICSLN